MKKYIALIVLISAAIWSSGLSSAAKPSDFGLKEGDLISAIFSDDPDVYIINEHGYKRLFLNPEIFKFYGHLGGFAKVNLVTPEIRDVFPTSGYFRDCESNDRKVYGVEVKGEDTGELRWIDVSGEDAVKNDSNFFKKVFCINNKEFSWYPKGKPFVAVTEVPSYSRGGGGSTATSATPATPAVPATPATPASPSQPHASPTPVPATPAQPATPAVPASTPTPTPITSPTPTPTPTPTILPSLIQENFNSYSDGIVVGQGGWYDRANGLPWVVEGSVMQEGAKAIYNNNTEADSVITKNNGGNKLANGKQSFYIRTQNRSDWNTRATNFQIGIFQGSWDGPSRATLGFEKDGNVNYVNGSNDARVNFDTYVNDAWNLVEIEWRSSDASARYRINNGTWTSWIPFTGGSYFTGFDTVGFVTWYLGNGGVYIDNLQ